MPDKTAWPRNAGDYFRHKELPIFKKLIFGSFVVDKGPPPRSCLKVLIVMMNEKVLMAIRMTQYFFAISD